MEADRRRLVYLNVESISTPRRVGNEQTARFVRQFLRRYRPELRERAVRVVVASSDQHESGVGGGRRGCPLLLAAGTPKAPHLRIHTIKHESINRTDPRLSSGIVRRPALCDRGIRSGGPVTRSASTTAKVLKGRTRSSPMLASRSSSARLSASATAAGSSQAWIEQL